MGFHITDWTSEKEDTANQDGEGFPGPLVQGLNGHAFLFYFVAPLSPTSRPFAHDCVVLLRGWSEGGCSRVLLHTCDSGREIPEPCDSGREIPKPLLLVLPHLTASQSLEGLLCICSKVPLNSPSLSIWLVADLFGIP